MAFQWCFQTINSERLELINDEYSAFIVVYENVLRIFL